MFNLIFNAMKRVLVAMLGLASIVACSKTEVVSVSEGNTIKFDNAFVGNPTKAGLPTENQYGASNLPPHFFVYAKTSDADVVFEGDKVYPSNGVWVYDDLEKWESDKIYNFAAYAAKDELTETVAFDYLNHELKITSFESSNIRQTDLLLATSDEHLTTNVKVPFTFKHALAMIKFTLKNGLGNNDLTISNFQIEGINTKGDVKIANSNKLVVWENVGTEDVFSNSGNITSTQAAAGVSDEFVVIPQNEEIIVKFKVTVTNKPDVTKDLTATITVDKTNWECGKRYNYVATITGTDMDVIEFADPVVDDWEDYNDPGTDFDF